MLDPSRLKLLVAPVQQAAAANGGAFAVEPTPNGGARGTDTTMMVLAVGAVLAAGVTAWWLYRR